MNIQEIFLTVEKKNPSMHAFIREAECIGCAKCIQACPVDAIVGTGKSMHTVIIDECMGCELCIPPCPVDCIDMITISQNNFFEKKAHYLKRHQTRQMRLATEKAATKNNKINEKKAYIQAAVLRAKIKRENLKKQGTL